MRALRRAMLAFGILVGLGIPIGLWQVHRIAEHLPSIDGLQPKRSEQPITLVSSDGTVLATLRCANRRPVSLDRIAPALIDATVATEDARFYQHGAIDPRGIVRAFWHDLIGADKKAEGASTLTQQLARCLYLSDDKTLHRKIEEALLAERIERRYSKRRILEAYLNTVYYGSGAYGAEAAAQTYFGCPARDLSLGQAALLAGLPQRPAALTPLYHPAAALRRRDHVLARMVAVGKITRAEADATRLQPLHLRRPAALDARGWRAPYFVAHVIDLLRNAYGGELPDSSVRVETTLNWPMQQAAERALKAGLARSGGANTGAIVAIEPANGAVRALVGGPDFARDQFDAAVQGARQPGSAFKPLVYAAAFDASVCNLVTQIEDVPTAFPGVAVGAGDYVVHNYDRAYHGKVSVLEALRESINTVAVRVASQTGLDSVVSYARLMGIDTPLEAGLPLALGASAVHPISLCSAYTAFANNGVRFDPVCIERIVGANGAVLFQDDPQSRCHVAFLHPPALDEINVALREVVLHGTGIAAATIRDAHGKTGTTSSHRDAWFVGYTGELATAVWVARVQRRPLRYLPMSTATGGSLCAPIWRDFMAPAQAIAAREAAARGQGVRSVSEPTKDEECARLSQLDQEAQTTSNADPAGSQPGSLTVAPAGYQAAQDGSGPIIVTAPETADEDTTVDEDTPPVSQPASARAEPETRPGHDDLKTEPDGPADDSPHG
jgi:penicillin-binding protein 1A